MARVRVTVSLDAGPAADLVARARQACLPPVITDAVLAGAQTYRDGARWRAPKLSGRLADSIEARTTGDYSAETSTDLVYAQITEFGGVHRPVDGKVLAWSGPGGPVFRAYSVNPAQPYFLPTFDQDSDRAVRDVVGVIDAHIGLF